MLLVCRSSLPVVYRLISNSPTHFSHSTPKSLQNPNGLSWGVFAENIYKEGEREWREGGSGGRERGSGGREWREGGREGHGGWYIKRKES